VIPLFADGINLPPGGHECTWDELVERFCHSPRRQILCRRLRSLLESAKSCGALKVLVDGSFPTSKEEPGDLDLSWIVPVGIKMGSLRRECRELFSEPWLSRERFGCDTLCFPIGDNCEKIQKWAVELGFDARTRSERGMVLVDLSCI
jgi:hypothetical protein